MDNLTNELKNGQLILKGMVKEIREFEDRDKQKIYEHLLVEPAKDEYSYPKTYPVCSRKILGAVGQVMTALAEIQSWQSRGFFNMRLWAVEGV